MLAAQYPYPTKQIINLAYQAQTTGLVTFELIDPLGEVVMQQELASGETFAQFTTGNLNSGLYYWRLEDSERIIKTGKIVIIK